MAVDQVITIEVGIGRGHRQEGLGNKGVSGPVSELEKNGLEGKEQRAGVSFIS